MKNKKNSIIALLISIAMVFAASPFGSYATDPPEATGEPEESAATESTAPETPEAPQPEIIEEKSNDNSALIAEYEAKIANANDKLKDIKAKQKEIENNISAVKDEKQKKVAVVNNLDSQISLTTQTISAVEDRLSGLLTEIEVKEAGIEEKTKVYEKNRAVFLKRSKAMYMYDTSTTLGLVLGADDFADFLTTTDMLIRIADHDQTLMEELEDERVVLEEEKEALEISQVSAEADKKEAEVLKQTLATQRSTAAAAVQDVSALEDQYNKDLADYEKKAAAMESEISNIYKQIELSKSPYVGGAMAWPVPGYSSISSVYGWRFGGSDFHTGMDITGGGVNGAPVVAANDGKVVYVNWSHSPGRGYGIYVMVDHGGEITTLYAHLSNIQVTVGQEVKRGQVIGNVGSTGWSTGPHLHFEVRVNGKHQNPYPYVKG